MRLNVSNMFRGAPEMVLIVMYVAVVNSTNRTKE